MQSKNELFVKRISSKIFDLGNIDFNMLLILLTSGCGSKNVFDHESAASNQHNLPHSMPSLFLLKRIILDLLLVFMAYKYNILGKSISFANYEINNRSR